MSGFYSVEGWNRDREDRERQREGQAQGSLLAQIPVDAPYDDPEAVIEKMAEVASRFAPNSAAMGLKNAPKL